MKRLMRWLLSGCLAVAFCFAATETVLSHDATVAETGTAYVTGMTAGRARALVAAAVGLVSLIVGWRAKVRAGGSRRMAIAALVSGFVAIFLSIAHLANTTGGFGTGGGKAGNIVAFALGLAGSCLGGFVLALKKNNKTTMR